MKLRRLVFPLILAVLLLPGAYAAAQTTGNISGVISTPDLPAGSIVTIVASTEYFHGQPVLLSTFSASGSSFSYTLTLPAPAAYIIAAVGFDMSAVQVPPPGTPIGIYTCPV